MPRELPDELTGLSEEEKAQRRERLVDESKEARRELEAEQEKLLASLDNEHGGDFIETAVTLPGDNLAHVECVLNGSLMDRMAHVDATLAALDDDGDPSPGNMTSVGDAMDEVAAVLADVTVEAKYSKEVFFEIYRRYGPEALGTHVEAVFGAVEKEVNRRAGAAKGFREQP